jgi:hypothetical protein
MESILHFSITGEFVTETARNMLYLEDKPYKNVEAFLLSCMLNSDISLKKKKKYVREILQGNKKFITSGNQLELVLDNTDILKEYECFFQKQNEEINEEEEPIDPVGSLIENTRQDYGWLSPDGKFYPVPWGEHGVFARDYIEKNIPDAPDMDEEDYLIKIGWILIHSPICGKPRIECQNATKRQKEFLWDYWMDRDDKEEANAIWAE